MKRKFGFLATLLLVLSCGPSKPKTAEQAAPRAAPVQGRVSAEISVTPGQPGPNQDYAIAYAVMNGTNRAVKVLRIETGRGPIGPNSPGWRQDSVEPGQRAIVALAVGRTGASGGEILIATFVTDLGAYDAAPVRVGVAQAAPAAPATALAGTIRTELSITPDSIQTGQPATLSYYLIDSTATSILVSSVEIDSPSPLVPGAPGWMTNRVASGTRGLVARRTIARTDPGTYTFNARFNTNQGVYDAGLATLLVFAPVPQDTGHVSARIDVSPNPCPVGSDYTIDYRIVNTTLKDLEVSSISTDLGTIDSSKPEWRDGVAHAGQTTTIAEINGTGGAVTSRSKSATFLTAGGQVSAAPVLLIIE